MPYLEAFMRSRRSRSRGRHPALLASLQFYLRKNFWVSGLALFLSVFGDRFYVRHVVRC